MTILLIARKEFLQIWSDGRLRLIFALLGVLFVLAGTAGWLQQQAAWRQYHEASHGQRELWLNQGQVNPHSATHHGMHVFKPIHPLTALDQGLQAYQGVSLFLESHKQNQTRWRPAEDGTLLQRFAPLNAAVLAGHLVPLLIILLSFGAFASERESGTLRQLLSLGLSPQQLWWGKLTGIAAALLVLLLPVVGGGALALLLSNGPAALWTSGPRLLAWLGVYLLYGLLFLWLSLLVSARARRARMALVILLGFWFMNTFIGPRLGMSVAALLQPTPGPLELQAAIATDTAALPDWDTRQRQVEARLLRQYGVRKVSQLPVNPAGVVLAEAEADDSRVHQRHFDALAQAQARQLELYAASGLLWPGVAVQLLSMAFSGSDWQHHQDFMRAAEAFRLRYVQRLNSDITRQRQQIDAWEYTAGQELWSQIKPFHYTLPPLRTVLRQQALPLVLPMLWLLALIGLTGPLLRRLPVD
jgi:ABC-2 type transport system permease protein